MDDSDLLADRRPTIAPATYGATELTTLIAGTLVIAGLYLGRELLVPMVLAVLLAFVLAPVVRVLRRLRLGDAISVVATVIFAFAVIGAIGLAVSGQIVELARNLPDYQAAIRTKVDALRLGETLAGLAGIVQGLEHSIGGGPGAGVPGVGAPGTPAPPPAAPVQAEAPLGVVLGVAERVLAPLATAGLVVVFVIFVLLYREDLRDRLIRLAGARDLHRTVVALNDAAYRLSRFFLAQVALNAGFGVFIAVGLWLIGLPNPILWGILAGLMRFVPFIGTFIAVIPPVLLALAVDPGWSTALWVLGLFLASEPLMGQVFEPLLYGHSTGLSPVSVILSATFWAFLWGPIGLLLATPLTVLLVVLGRHVERLRFLDIMLGDQPPLRPEESFYQRALEGDADALVAQARRYLKESEGSVAGFADEVALRGLVLAQADWTREVLEPERLEVMRGQLDILLDELANAEVRPLPEAAAMPAEWRHPGAVLCIGGQGPFDEAAAALAAQVLRSAGLGARSAGNGALNANQQDALDPAVLRLCILSVLEEGSSAASVRYFLRRLHQRVPEARVVIGLWRADAESPTLQALRSEAPGDTIVTSVGEAVALCTAMATQPAEPQPAA